MTEVTHGSARTKALEEWVDYENGTTRKPAFYGHPGPGHYGPQGPGPYGLGTYGPEPMEVHNHRPEERKKTFRAGIYVHMLCEGRAEPNVLTCIRAEPNVVTCIRAEPDALTCNNTYRKMERGRNRHSNARGNEQTVRQTN